MKKVFTIIISAIAFGIIAGAVMVGINVASKEFGIVKENTIADAVSPNVPETRENTESNTTNGSTFYYIGDDDVSSLVDSVMPSVVSITNMVKYVQYGYSPFNFRRQAIEKEAPASGSGVIVRITDDEVIIITNNHVVADSTSLSVTFNDSETVDALIKGTDSSNDLAIISVKTADIKKEILQNLKPITLGDSDKVKVGEKVIAIGNALGIGQSVTAGIISAKDREIEDIDNSSKLIQTDAAINPGNSGGALLNAKGELIGINVAKTSGNAVEGMGYAIPVNTATAVIDTLSNKKARETIKEEDQGYLGITARNIDQQIAESLDMPEGIYVYKISENSAAAKSDLKEKDIIISFDDQNVKTLSELQNLLKYTHAGDTVSMKVKRIEGGVYVEKTFDIVLGKREASEKETQAEPKQEETAENNQGSQEGYYDPFSDFDDIFRNFGFRMW